MAITTTKLNGTVLKLYVDTVLLGYVTEESFDISANIIETSNKDSAKFSEFIAGRTTSTMSFSAMHQFDATEGYKELFADISNGHTNLHSNYIKNKGVFFHNLLA